MYYQNVFDSEFVGILLLGDRQLSLNFRVKGNVNTSHEMIAWNREPYDVSSSSNLTLNYSFDAGRTWTILTVDVSASAADDTAATCYEIANALNNDATFKELYEASVINEPKTGNYLKIRAKRPRGNWKTYISNSSAESVLRFNKKAGIAELPSYFSRHVIGSAFPDSVNMLIELSDPVSGVDVNIVEDAGFDSGTVREDWELLDGRSGMFNFQKMTVDGSDRITEIIEYPAGAGVGDLARKINYEYSGSNKNPDQITEVPYTLESGDLVTP
jgi:hypothetical protein